MSRARFPGVNLTVKSMKLRSETIHPPIWIKHAAGIVFASEVQESANFTEEFIRIRKQLNWI